jgi:GntR family transcriptional repressor for pyruvate dehydrogenase complex
MATVSSEADSSANGAKQLTKLPSHSRQSDVASQIRDYIVQNDLTPGDRLPGEEWFAAELGVGRPLVREALKGLEAVGAVETKKGVGRFVSAFEADAYLRHFTTEVLAQSFSQRDLAEVRCLLEVAAIGDVVPMLTDEDIAQIVAYLDEMKAQLARGEEITEADIGIHRTIMSRSENQFVVSMLEAIYALTMATDEYLPGTKIPKPPRDRKKVAHDVGEHERLVAAVVARDAAAARAALMAHFETTAGRINFTPLWRQFVTAEMNTP